MQRNEITSQFPRYFLLVMSFGAKVTKVKKIIARSKTVEENAQLREAVKGVKFLVFWIREKNITVLASTTPGGHAHARLRKNCLRPNRAKFSMEAIGRKHLFGPQ